MKQKLLIALVLSSLSSPMAFAENKWSGGVAWRYLLQKKDDGLNSRDASQNDNSKQTTRAHQIRADLNTSATNEVWDWGFGLRTYSSATSEWLTVQQNADRNVTIENAYLRPHWDLGSSQIVVTLGRGKTVILNDTLTQVLFDKDVRWDGLGWAWKMDNFGLNLTQYVLGARNAGASNASTYSETPATEADASQQGGFAMLYSFQPHVKFKVAEEVEATVALGYHVWSGASGMYTNQVHGGNRNSMAGVAVGNTTDVTMDNPRQWHLYTDWTLPYNLKFSAEYVRNKDVFYGTPAAPTDKKAQNSAWGLALAYGKVKKANDFSVSYAYVQKGIASVVNSFTNGNMKADNIGHLFDAKYGLADSYSIGAKVELYREKALLAGDGVAVPAPNQNRKQTENRYEFVAAMTF
jgi:hypothetical protein